MIAENMKLESDPSSKLIFIKLEDLLLTNSTLLYIKIVLFKNINFSFCPF